jgi:hypothetical protein
MKHARSMDRPHIFFSFELSYWRPPETRSWAGARGTWSSLTKSLLQSPPSLCRMVVASLVTRPDTINQIGQRLAV